MQIDKNRIIPLFIPNRGCSYKCIFCDQNKITGIINTAQNDMDLIPGMQKKIESYMTDSQNYDEIALYGGSFTAISEGLQLEILRMAGEYVANGRVKSIRISTRPDCVNKDILRFLQNNNVSTVEIAAQAMDDEVLRLCGRGHTVSDVRESAKLIKAAGMLLGIQMMIGLPGDSDGTKSLVTADEIIKINPDYVRIYPLLVFRGTLLEKMYNEHSYTPLNLEKAITICSRILIRFYLKKINVIRVGLDPAFTEDSSSFVAGPWHPAFREAVETEIYWYLFMKVYKLGVNLNTVIAYNPLHAGKVIGVNSINKKRIKSLYQGVDIKLLQDPDVEAFSLKLIQANGSIKIGLSDIQECYA